MKRLGFKSLETPSRKTGYIIRDLPQNFYPLMDEYVNMHHNDLAEKELVGHLTSYIIDCKSDKLKDFHNYISILALDLDMHLDRNNEKLELRRFWVNYQNKHEFNPMHIHDGDYSFVIWYKIPYIIENEKMKFPNVNYDQILNGYFNFYYEAEGHVKVVNLPVDKTWEKTICIFPSDLQHGVMPFYTSNEYRVTFSGNVYSA